MQTYTNHRITAAGLLILTDKGTEILVPFDSARQLIKDLCRQLGDFHDQGDDQRPHPLPGMKYGRVE